MVVILLPVSPTIVIHLSLRKTPLTPALKGPSRAIIPAIIEEIRFCPKGNSKQAQVRKGDFRNANY
jgi:hypothetical protein